MISLTDFPLQLFLVLLVGGVIGAERQHRSKSAGFRTIILICLGSFLFTTFSRLIGGSTTDRIASSVVAGIGFLGAGVIFRAENRVSGITTAAAIWVTAALGMGIAMGYYKLVIVSAVLTVVALVYLLHLESFFDKISQTRTYKIECDFDDQIHQKYEHLLKTHHLSFKRLVQIKEDNRISGTWQALGSEKNHERFVQEVIRDEKVRRFEF